MPTDAEVIHPNLVAVSQDYCGLGFLDGEIAVDIEKAEHTQGEGTPHLNDIAIEIDPDGFAAAGVDIEGVSTGEVHHGVVGITISVLTAAGIDGHVEIIKGNHHVIDADELGRTDLGFERGPGALVGLGGRVVGCFRGDNGDAELHLGDVEAQGTLIVGRTVDSGEGRALAAADGE